MGGRIHAHKEVRALRKQGLTYGEINARLGTTIPRGSMSYICRGIVLSDKQSARIKVVNEKRLANTRQLALAANRRVLSEKITGYRKANMRLGTLLKGRDVQLIALAMLHWGEGSKWKSYRGLSLGSTDPIMVVSYINLLRNCYNLPLENMHGRIQHRADQDPNELIDFWAKTTGINRDRFYRSYIDKRTIGKPTTKPGYKGICKVSCPGTNIQLELEQIAGIISSALGI